MSTATEAPKTANAAPTKINKQELRKAKLAKKALKVRKTAPQKKAVVEQQKQRTEKVAAQRKERAARQDKRTTKRKELTEKRKAAGQIRKKVVKAPKEKKATPAAAAVPPVPETILKKRKAQQQKVALKRRRAAKAVARRTKLRKVIFKRAANYVRQYRDAERSLIKLRRAARAGGNFFREPEPKLAVVIRIRGINGVDPKTRKILQLLRLRQIQNAVFVRLNGATLKMLKLVEPYITYGTPNLKTVRQMIYKRGYIKCHGQRLPITDNRLIEKRFKKKSILCVEDIINQVFTVGKHFKSVNKALWPFKLSSPRGGYVKKTVHFQEGGDAGNREDKINQFVQRMI